MLTYALPWIGNFRDLSGRDAVTTGLFFVVAAIRAALECQLGDILECVEAEDAPEGEPRKEL